MNLTEIKAWIEENKENQEVKTFVEGLNPINLEKIKSLASNDKDIKSWLDSEKDKHSSKSLETWKTNNLEKVLEDKIKERFPQADPKDTELAKLKAEIEKMQKESLRKDLTNKAIKIATDKKLPVELIDYLIGEDEEITTKNIEKLESVFGTHVESLVQERLKTNSYTPPTGGSTPTGTYEELLKNADNMTSAQVAEMFSKINK